MQSRGKAKTVNSQGSRTRWAGVGGVW